MEKICERCGCCTLTWHAPAHEDKDDCIAALKRQRRARKRKADLVADILISAGADPAKGLVGMAKDVAAELARLRLKPFTQASGVYGYRMDDRRCLEMGGDYALFDPDELTVGTVRTYHGTPYRVEKVVALYHTPITVRITAVQVEAENDD